MNPSSPSPLGDDVGNHQVADLVVDAVLAVPGVVRLHGGMYGEVATYLPGRRVFGVQVREASTHVHVVLGWDSNIATTTDQIREVAQTIVRTPVDVTVEDLELPTASDQT